MADSASPSGHDRIAPGQNAASASADSSTVRNRGLRPSSAAGPALGALRVAAGSALLAAILLGVHVTASDPATGSVLRIAIRTTAGTAQVCHRLTQQELDALPVHMRRPESCETHAVPYRLEIASGGAVLLDRTYEAAGLHGDRPLTVNEDVPVASGRRDVTIRFTPVGDATASSPSFSLQDTIDFPDSRIRVAVLEPKSEGFEVR